MLHARGNSTNFLNQIANVINHAVPKTDEKGTTREILPVTYEPDGHDPDVEDGDDEKDDGNDDAVGEDDGVRAGEVVEDGGLRQYSAAVLALQEILQRVNCRPGGFITQIL